MARNRFFQVYQRNSFVHLESSFKKKDCRQNVENVGISAKPKTEPKFIEILKL